MTNQIDITMHIDEDATPEDREILRDELLSTEGVLAAAYQDEESHLIVMSYNPDVLKSISLSLHKNKGLHAEPEDL